MASADLGNLHIFYEDMGSGPVVLLIHGSFTRGDEAFSSLLPRLAARYRVLCPDLRGHGRSRCEDLFWDEPMLARDMLRLLNAVGVERAHMVGHSMGGDVAMSCAVMQPERALSLVSIGSAGLANPALARYLDRLAPERAERARHSAFFAHLEAQHQAAHRGDWRRMFRQTIESCMRYPDFSPADLARLRMPFLLLYGEKDDLVLPEEVAHLAACCPDFRSCVIPGAGHSPQSSARFLPETARILLDFFEMAQAAAAAFPNLKNHKPGSKPCLS